MHTRRTMLGAAAVSVASVSVAGCTGALGTGADSGGGDADGVTLEELSIQNANRKPHEIQLAVEADGDVLHLGAYELDANGDSRTVDGEWAERPGAYRIHATLDDGEVRTADVTDGINDETGCVRVLIRIDGDGELAVWNGSNCGPDAEEPEPDDATG